MPTSFNPNFSKLSNYDKNANAELVRFGADAPLTEAELNELQLIQNNRRYDLIKAICGNGLTDSGEIKYSNGVLSIKNKTAFVDGYMVYIDQINISFSPNAKVYLNVFETEVGVNDTLKKYGNVNGSDITNYIKDSRYEQEISRRIVICYELSTTQREHSLLICTFGNTNAVQPTFSDTRIQTGGSDGKKLLDDSGNPINVGSPTKAVYFEDGVPKITEIMPDSMGDLETPVYVNNGRLKPLYSIGCKLSRGNVTLSMGNSNKPVFLNDGDFYECETLVKESDLRQLPIFSILDTKMYKFPLITDINDCILCDVTYINNVKHELYAKLSAKVVGYNNVDYVHIVNGSVMAKGSYLVKTPILDSSKIFGKILFVNNRATLFLFVYDLSNNDTISFLVDSATNTQSIGRLYEYQRYFIECYPVVNVIGNKIFACNKSFEFSGGKFNAQMGKDYMSIQSAEISHLLGILDGYGYFVTGERNHTILHVCQDINKASDTATYNLPINIKDITDIQLNRRMFYIVTCYGTIIRISNLSEPNNLVVEQLNVDGTFHQYFNRLAFYSDTVNNMNIIVMYSNEKIFVSYDGITFKPLFLPTLNRTFTARNKDVICYVKDGTFSIITNDFKNKSFEYKYKVNMVDFTTYLVTKTYAELLRDDNKTVIVKGDVWFKPNGFTTNKVVIDLPYYGGYVLSSIDIDFYFDNDHSENNVNNVAMFDKQMINVGHYGTCKNTYAELSYNIKNDATTTHACYRLKLNFKKLFEY